MRGLTILGTLIIVAQVLLSLYQIRYYNAFMNKLIKRYDTCPGYTLTTEVEKNCISSVVLVVITDSQDTIIEAYIYAGLTIFSQFKPCDVLTGKTISQNLKNEIAKEKPSLKQRAIHSFLSKK